MRTDLPPFWHFHPDTAIWDGTILWIMLLSPRLLLTASVPSWWPCYSRSSCSRNFAVIIVLFASKDTLFDITPFNGQTFHNRRVERPDVSHCHSELVNFVTLFTHLCETRATFVSLLPTTAPLSLKRQALISLLIHRRIPVSRCHFIYAVVLRLDGSDIFLVSTYLFPGRAAPLAVEWDAILSFTTDTWAPWSPVQSTPVEWLTDADSYITVHASWSEHPNTFGALPPSGTCFRHSWYCHRQEHISPNLTYASSTFLHDHSHKSPGDGELIPTPSLSY